MSSEEDKPPAPPVRLTSTNRGNSISIDYSHLINVYGIKHNMTFAMFHINHKLPKKSNDSLKL